MDRPPIYGIEVFLTIVQEGSLRSAAKALGVGAPAVSHQLKMLEKKMGVDLLHRTTRSIELTDAGRVLLDNAGPAYRDITYAIKKVQQSGKSTKGTLRLNLARGAYITAIAPILGKFQTENPDITLEISLNEGLVDIIGEGFHAGIRLGDLVADNMVALRLTPPLTPAFSATSDYLDKYGRPQHPRDLLNHCNIRYKPPTAGKMTNWEFIENGQEKTINPPTRLIFDNIIGVVQAARESRGIGWSLRATIQEYLDNGSLETVLDQYVKKLPPFYLYYPKQNRRVECLRLLIDCLISQRNSEKNYSNQ